MGKAIVLLVLFLGELLSDSIVGTISIGSRHFLSYKLNEENGGIGIGYQREHSPKLSSQIDYIRFTNSYSKPTSFTGYSLNYTPWAYKEAKLGMFGSVVYNDGYCGFFGDCRKGMDNTGVLPLFGAVAQLDNIVVKASALPNIAEKKIDAVVWTIQMKIVEF